MKKSLLNKFKSSEDNYLRAFEDDNSKAYIRAMCDHDTNLCEYKYEGRGDKIAMMVASLLIDMLEYEEPEWIMSQFLTVYNYLNSNDPSIKKLTLQDVSQFEEYELLPEE